jgi:hypothetical protein
MGTLLDDQDRRSMLDRLGALTPTAERLWGRMAPAQMCRHLSASARMALGELPVKSKNMLPFQIFPLKHLLLYVLPFPKGAPTAPELVAKEAYDFEQERAQLVELLNRIATDAADGPVHPLFGRLSRREWGALVYKHSDHHLRQFAV